MQRVECIADKGAMLGTAEMGKPGFERRNLLAQQTSPSRDAQTRCVEGRLAGLVGRCKVEKRDAHSLAVESPCPARWGARTLALYGGRHCVVRSVL